MACQAAAILPRGTANASTAPSPVAAVARGKAPHIGSAIAQDGATDGDDEAEGGVGRPRALQADDGARAAYSAAHRLNH